MYVTVNGVDPSRSASTPRGLVYGDLKPTEPFMFAEGTVDYTGHGRIKSQTKGFTCISTGKRYQQADKSVRVNRIKVDINWQKVAA